MVALAGQTVFLPARRAAGPAMCVSLALRRCMGSGFSPGEGEAIAAAAVVVVVFVCLGSWSTIYGYGVETLANTDDNPQDAA